MNTNIRHVPETHPLDEHAYHGGSFWTAAGAALDRPSRLEELVTADVLDAWFPPAPAVLEAIHGALALLCRTSPPTHAEGVRETIATARGVPEESVITGAGSSDLIFRAFTNWLTPSSRVVITDPIYSEYPHVIQRVVGCEVVKVPLRASRGFSIDARELRDAIEPGCDLVVLVNPSSPSGACANITRVLAECAAQNTRVWLDETYIDFHDPTETREREASMSDNLVVCKTMSKAYALSGLRAAYAVASPELLAPLRAATPPWNLPLPAQAAACAAMRESTGYYQSMWKRTAQLRWKLVRGLDHIAGIDIVSDGGPMALVRLEQDIDTDRVLQFCREKGVYLRDARPMFAPRLHSDTRGLVRIAVQPPEKAERLLDTIRDAILVQRKGRRTSRSA